MILITGANGNLGRRLIAELIARDADVRAVVRSTRAAQQILDLGLTPAPEIVTLDYLDAVAMTEAMRGCSRVVHLVGIIKENSGGSYHDAHERTAEVLVAAARDASIEQIVYISIVGTALASANACLASKAAAEQILLEAAVPAMILRVPMVLGEGDYASRALDARGGRRFNVLLRAGSLEQPIYAGDVVAAIVAGLHMPAENVSLDLAGRESLTRGALTRAAAAARGRSTTVVSLPLWVGLLVAAVLEKISPDPPVTRAMLGVLDHDDAIDPSGAAELLGLELTDLNTMLRRCVTAGS